MQPEVFALASGFQYQFFKFPPARKLKSIMTLNLHVYNTPFTHKSRILKITEWLSQNEIFDRIEVAAIWQPGLAREEALDQFRHVVRRPAAMGRSLPGAIGKLAGFLEWYVRLLGRYGRQRIDLINAHCLTVLPLCVILKGLSGAKLIYDTHELETETSEATPLRRSLTRFVERTCMRFVDSTAAVGDSIADWYRKEYSLPSVHVVKNYPPRREGPPQRNSLLRTSLAIPDSSMLFIYHGNHL